LTDNGKCFTGWFGPRPVEVLFDRILRENGISHRHTGIRSPTTTGKIERFHQSLRREFLDGKTFASFQQAQRELDDWVADYNTSRPHQALEMATPAERFRLAPVADPAASIPIQQAEDTHVAGCVRIVEQARRADAASTPRSVRSWSTPAVSTSSRAGSRRRRWRPSATTALTRNGAERCLRCPFRSTVSPTCGPCSGRVRNESAVRTLLRPMRLAPRSGRIER
jgi:hypothetical protein